MTLTNNQKQKLIQATIDKLNKINNMVGRLMTEAQKEYERNGDSQRSKNYDRIINNYQIEMEEYEAIYQILTQGA